MIASIQSGGVGCLSLHLGPAGKELGVDEALDLLEDPRVMPIEVEFPRELEGVIGSCQAHWEFSEGWRHKGGMSYEATLNDAFVVFMHAVYMAALDALGMEKGDPSNYWRLHGAGIFAYSMLYILAGEGRIEEPFKEVVMRHPRQCHGLLTRDRGYRKRGAERVANGFIDIFVSF